MHLAAIYVAVVPMLEELGFLRLGLGRRLESCGWVRRIKGPSGWRAKE